MTADDILKILDSLSNYIVYIYPGYITIYVYNFLRANTAHESKGVVVKSIAISFLYTVCVDKVPTKSDLYYHFIIICISLIVPYIAYLFQNSEVACNVFNGLEISTKFEGNEIDLLDDGEISAWVKVYLRDDDVVYEGFLGERELEENRRKFITLKKYRKYLLDNSGHPVKPYIEDFDNDDDKVVIYYDDIKRIEKNKIESDDE